MSLAGRAPAKRATLAPLLLKDQRGNARMPARAEMSG